MNWQWLTFLEHLVGKVFLTAVIFLSIAAFGRQFMVIDRLNKEIAGLVRDKIRLTEGYGVHQDVLDSYQEPWFIEDYARSNLEMIYPGEVRIMDAHTSDDIKESAGRTEEILH